MVTYHVTASYETPRGFQRVTTVAIRAADNADAQQKAGEYFRSRLPDCRIEPADRWTCSTL